MTNPDLKRTLVDVREAQRLLFAYYRRTMDTVRLLGDQFDGHVFYQWSSVVTDHPPMKGTKPFDRWAWDFLPLNSVSFLYTAAGQRSARIHAGDWMLEIHVSTDSEFSHAKDFKAEPDPQTFLPANASRSEIAIIAWKCIADFQKDRSWLQVWSQGYWPDEKSEQQRNPFEALEGIHSFQLKRLIEDLATRSDVIEFAEAAKREFKHVLGLT